MEITKERGFTELQIISKAEYSDFYSFAHQIQEKLSIKFIDKVDDFDSLYWTFDYNNFILVLAYDVFFGIMIYPCQGIHASESENHNAEKFAAVLIEYQLI